MVGYIGYGGGRSMHVDHLTWASAGYNHLIMDTCGQGSGWASGGATAQLAAHVRWLTERF